MYPGTYSHQKRESGNGGGYVDRGATTSTANWINGSGPLGNQQFSTAGPSGPGILPSAGIFNAATGGPAETAGASFQGHVQDRATGRDNSESGGATSAAASTPAASTSSGSSRRSANNRPANSKYACPHFALDGQTHFECLGVALRDISAVFTHVEKKHKRPDIFCDRCWEVFGSRDQLAAHRDSRTPCCGQPDPHWISEETLAKISNPRRRAGSGRIGWDGFTWHCMFRTLFPDVETPPTFFNTSYNIVEVKVWAYLQSSNYEKFCQGNEWLDFFARRLMADLIDQMQEDQFSRHEEPTMRGGRFKNSHLDYSSIPQRPVPRSAQNVSIPVTTESQPLDLDGQETSSFMSTQQGFRPSDPMPFSSFQRDPQFELPEGQPTHSQLHGHSGGSTYSPSPDIAGYADFPGLTRQTASQVFNYDFCDDHASVRPLNQSFALPNSTHTLPMQPLLPQQTTRRSQAVPHRMASDPKQGRRRPFGGCNDATASYSNSQNYRQ